jgi:uncharacterized protein YndB with AHSA1/START domain
MTIDAIRDDKIIEDWAIAESLGVFQQSGVLPPTAEFLTEFARGGGKGETMPEYRITRSITSSVDLRVSPERAFEFLNNPENWPRWAIVNLKSVKAAADGWYDTETRQGKGQLKMLSNKSLGLLDHVWKDPQASWTVHARVIPNGDGSTFLITFLKPPVMDDRAFDAAAREVDRELGKLKEILEGE